MIKFIRTNVFATIILLTYIFLFIFNSDIAITAFQNSGYYIIEMIQILPVIFLLIVAIEVLIPKEWIINNLGKNSGIKGSFFALIFGSISAGPIYAAFPIVKMLYDKGASIKSIVIILCSWAVVKVPMLANEIKFLGPKFMLIRWVLTVAAIFCMGWIMEKMKVTIEGSDDIKAGLQIKSEYCIGCGKCYRLAPDYFKANDNKAIVLSNLVNEKENLNQIDLDLITEAVVNCPTKAIVYQE